MDGEARLQVTLLGAFRVTRGAAPLRLPGARLPALLARLALAGGRPVEPGLLIDAIWAGEPPAGAAHALQALVSRLRRALGRAGDVARTAGGYRLDVGPGEVDVLRFEQLAAAGRERLRTGDPDAAAALLGQAVERWGDRPGAEPTAVAAVAPAAAVRLARISIDAVADLADAELSAGRAEQAADRLTALLAEHPVHERAAALLLDALAAQGRQAEALAAYERVREGLAETLGADPGAALRERHLRLLRTERPVEAAPSNLPSPLTGLIGRDDELARVGALLTAGRLVTVLGPGGAGKTRLAIEAARRHRDDYPDGSWLIDLAAVTEPAKVGAAVLAGTGLRGGRMFEARMRTGGDDLDLLAEQLGGRVSLLVIDNCEHVIDAVAHLVAALLSRCAGLRALATSREPLAIGGEALVPLGPLALPEPDDDVEQARRAASVRLFTERAAAVRPGFDLDETTLPDVGRVVRGLDGMPLALELAAARLRTLSLPELAEGLSDRFGLLTTGSRTALPRHRTLRAVIAWSWELLSEPERTVADRISVLPGGVTMASAAAVCGGTAVPATDLPDLLAGLVDRSLLQLAPEPGRYRMLETLREYGIGRLTESGSLDAVRDLAAGYFAELIAESDAELRGPGQLTAMRIIGAEYGNALAALRRRCRAGDAAGAVALALHLAWYWVMFGLHIDASYWLGEALAVPGGGEPTPERDCAHALHLLNRIATPGRPTPDESADVRAQMRDLTDRLLRYPELPGPYPVLTLLTSVFLEEEEAGLASVARVAEGDDVWLAGLVRMFRAQFAEDTGDLDRVRTDAEAALACFRQVGDRWGQAGTLPMRAQLRQYDGDLDGALADLREARSLADEFGSLSVADEVLNDLRSAEVYLRRGDADRALGMVGVARQRVARAASAEMLALVDACEAGLRLRLRDPDRAQVLLDAAEQRHRDSVAFPRDPLLPLIRVTRAALCLERGELSVARTLLAEVYARAAAAGELLISSLVAVSAAALAAAHRQPHDAAVLLGAASRLRGAHDRTDPRVRELSRRGQAALGADAFAEAYRKGWELDRATALAEVDSALG